MYEVQALGSQDVLEKRARIARILDASCAFRFKESPNATPTRSKRDDSPVKTDNRESSTGYIAIYRDSFSRQ